MREQKLFFGVENRKILLIGNISEVFLDTGAVTKKSCEIYTDMLDGIEAAGRESFQAVGVVMSAESAKLSSALKVLREVRPDSKIILLARMHEEPAAIRLVSSAFNGTTMADDYLICPLWASKFYESIESAWGRQRVEAPGPVVIDYVKEMKITHLEKLATTDELTGLKNRRYMWEFSRQIIEHAGGENGRVTLLVFDIDNFKHYNDVYGHSAGDEILRQAAVLMSCCCRGHDIVGRIGGDEFAVIFWDDPNRLAGRGSERRSAAAEHPKEAIFIAKRLRGELEKTEIAPRFTQNNRTAGQLHLLGPEGKGVLTISGGLASFPRDGSTIEELFGQADKALLEAKRSGKNRIYLVGKPQNDIANIE